MDNQKRQYNELAYQLVSTRILGTRKGSDEPAYEHSVRVSEALKKYEYPERVVIAGLLHDIVEDGGVSLQELVEFGFSEQVVHLVDLCSHDEAGENKDARWVKMIARLIDANDKDAWVIKLADVMDNAQHCGTLRPDRAAFIREVKVPLMLSVTKDVLGDEGIWNELNNLSKTTYGKSAE